MVRGVRLVSASSMDDPDFISFRRFDGCAVNDGMLTILLTREVGGIFVPLMGMGEKFVTNIGKGLKRENENREFFL